MEWNNKLLYLSDEEIKIVAMYLAYGIGLGMFLGIFIDNIPLCFSLGGVISIIISLIKCFINRYKKQNKL
ncbi:hypothetical protein JCM1393_11050 [Clostridium carnis]